jgi:hypothetical protein
MTIVKFTSAIILLAAASAVHAQSTAALPGDRGLASVNQNLENNPDNKGLQNASGQLQQNQIKHAEQLENKEQKREQHREQNAVRVETRADGSAAVSRPARIERPARTERSGK